MPGPQHIPAWGVRASARISQDSTRGLNIFSGKAIHSSLEEGFQESLGSVRAADSNGYLRWGATAKVRQLDDLYPRLRDEKSVAGSTSTIGAPVEHLDLATVIKISQAVSAEMVLERLIDTLMRTAIEHAGAERGLLILRRDNEPRTVAEATISGHNVTVHRGE